MTTGPLMDGRLLGVAVPTPGSWSIPPHTLLPTRILTNPGFTTLRWQIAITQARPLETRLMCRKHLTQDCWMEVSGLAGALLKRREDAGSVRLPQGKDIPK